MISAEVLAVDYGPGPASEVGEHVDAGLGLAFRVRPVTVLGR